MALAAGAAALNWDKIVKVLKGRKIAVLGARLEGLPTGKTIMIQFLAKGSLPKKYKATNRPEKVKADRGRFQLRELDLVIKDMIDVPGSKNRYDAWKRTTKEADIVMYLLRVDFLMAGHTGPRGAVRGEAARTNL